jgi:hypothetical protein
VDQATSRREPLSVAPTNRPFMAVIVVMLELPFDHIRHCLHSPMRMAVKDSRWEPILHHYRKGSVKGQSPKGNERAIPVRLRHAATDWR